MNTVTKSFNPSNANNSFGAKLAEFAFIVAATVLMIDLRESLVATSDGQSDAAFGFGL